MNHLIFVAWSLPWPVICLGCWLGWQLLRQNGRILLRLESIEDRLSLWEMEGGPSGNGKSKSLTRSRLNRDGLKTGTVAPNFRLPRVDGGELSLEEFRGQRVLLIFSDPQCGPCNQLAPALERFHRENSVRKDFPLLSDTSAEGRARHSVRAESSSPKRGAQGTDPRAIAIVMISRRDAAANRAKIKEHRLTFPVVLQEHWEISRLYAMFATPIAYLIGEQGVVAKDVAVGMEAIQALMAKATNRVNDREPAYA